MNDSYLTLAKKSEAYYKEKGSKFLAFAIPISSEEEVRLALESLRKEYHDARHHCYAYILGHKKEKFRANDDGEPKHSAGDPILGQIKSYNLTNVLIVVIRYFGGTKLGVSGLINAYKTSAQEAIKNGKIVEKIVKESITIYFQYPSMNKVMSLIKTYDLEVKEQNFEQTCKITVLVRLSQLSEIENKLSALGLKVS